MQHVLFSVNTRHLQPRAHRSLPKADDVFVPVPKHELKIDPDSRLLPFDASDNTVIDFYSVPQGPNAVTLKLQNVLVNADDNLTMPAITENLSDVDKARFISLP